MSHSVFQNVISQLKDTTKRTVGVIDNEGCVIACTDVSLIGERWTEAAIRLVGVSNQIASYNQRTFLGMVNDSGILEYAVFCAGEDEMARSLCGVICVTLSNAKISYEEKHDRGTFVKNIIMDNILPGDIYVRAKELRFATDAPRAVFLIRQAGCADVTAVDFVSGMFPDKQDDFVLSINETDVAVIKQFTQEPSGEALERMAQDIAKLLKKELELDTVIGIGTVAKHLRELADAYKEAQTAIDVGKVFDNEKTIINYESLGIGRLIYQLPATLCDIFLSEVFKKNSIDSLDQETLYTINEFFENDLNVSETSRKLFVHRNTLVYRLEKINKQIGLDLRKFDHAIVFKVAMMVRKYLASQDMR